MNGLIIVDTRFCILDAKIIVDTHFCILDAKINGRAFLSLNESRLERSGVSLGFQCTLMDIIESLVCDIHLH